MKLSVGHEFVGAGITSNKDLVGVITAIKDNEYITHIRYLGNVEREQGTYSFTEEDLEECITKYHLKHFSPLGKALK